MVKRKYVIFVLIFWAGLLLGFIASKQRILDTGSKVILQTVPVDPRDLFRGDYVILSYNISTIHLDSITSNSNDYQKGEELYVRLFSRSGGPAEAVELSKDRFSDGTFIAGKITYADSSYINLEYGIESYFVPQGEGRKIENQTGKLEVVVSINDKGKAVISKLKQ